MKQTWAMQRDKIRHFASFKDGWDSYRAIAPKPEAVERALQWAATFEAVGFPAAWVSPEGDGEIGFEWDVGEHTVAVSTDGDFAAFFTESIKLTAEQSTEFRQLIDQK